MSRYPSSFLCVALLAAPLELAVAQTPSVAADVSGYTALRVGGGTIPESERVPIPVTRNDAALHAEASGEGGSSIVIPGVAGQTGPGLTSAFASGFASADPGVLRVYGADQAIARPAVGVPQAGLGAAPNLDTVTTNISAGASFTDYLTVSHTGLAPGAEVQVPFIFLAEVVSNYTLGYPFYSLHPISAYASFVLPGLGPQNFSTESAYNPWTYTALGNGNGLYSIKGEWTYTAHVGDVLPISASFGIYGQADVSASSYDREFGGFADGRNTAGIWLGPLAEGLTLTSASGHDYTIDPTLAGAPVAAVPEPESYAMLLVGLAGIGWIARRRNANRSRR